MKTTPIGTKPKAVPKGQRYFWTTEWLRGERQASADIANGRVKSFDTAEALIADLRRERRLRRA